MYDFRARGIGHDAEGRPAIAPPSWLLTAGEPLRFASEYVVGRLLDRLPAADPGLVEDRRDRRVARLPGGREPHRAQRVGAEQPPGDDGQPARAGCPHEGAVDVTTDSEETPRTDLDLRGVERYWET